jgi:hypothetical protein
LRFLKERKAPATGEVQDILSGEGLHRRSLESEVVLWGAGEPGSLRWIVAGIIAKSSRKDPMQDVVSSGSSSRDSSRQRQKITSSPRGGEAAREALGGEGVQGRVQQLSLIILGHTDSDLIPCWSSDEDKEREVDSIDPFRLGTRIGNSTNRSRWGTVEESSCRRDCILCQ